MNLIIENMELWIHELQGVDHGYDYDSAVKLAQTAAIVKALEALTHAVGALDKEQN